MDRVTLTVPFECTHN